MPYLGGRTGRRAAREAVGDPGVGPLDRGVAEAHGEADVDGGEAVPPVRLGAVLEVDRGHREQHDLQQRLAQQQGQARRRHPEHVPEGQPGGQQHPEGHLARDDQSDDHDSLLFSLTVPGSRPGEPFSSSPVTKLAVHRKMQFGTVPGEQARARGPCWMEGMAVRRLPRPHRFDVYIAVGGLLGGLLLVGIGLGTRPSRDPMTLFDGPWPVLRAARP